MIRRLRLIQFMGVVGFVSCLSAGCTVDEQSAPAPVASSPLATANGSPSASPIGESRRHATPTCTAMQVRECRVELGAQGAVRNCFVGLQLCMDGKWGPCQEPDAVEAQLSSD